MVSPRPRPLRAVLFAVLLCVAATTVAASTVEDRLLALEQAVATIAELRATVQSQGATIAALARRCATATPLQGDAGPAPPAMPFAADSAPSFRGFTGDRVDGSDSRSVRQPDGEAPPVPCGCNTFNASVVTVTGDGGAVTQVVIGTPETGVINGVNIVALDNSAVKTSGDQAIAGTLTVGALKIGADWTLAETATGLSITGPAGGVTVLPNNGLQLAGAVVTGSATGGLEVAGPLTVGAALAAAQLTVSGVSTLAATAAASLAVSGDAKIAGTSTLGGAATVEGHNLDPSTYTSGWCDCYTETAGASCNHLNGGSFSNRCAAGPPVSPPINYQGEVGVVGVATGCQKPGYFPAGQPLSVVAEMGTGFQLYPGNILGYNSPSAMVCCRPCQAFS